MVLHKESCAETDSFQNPISTPDAKHKVVASARVEKKPNRLKEAVLIDRFYIGKTGISAINMHIALDICHQLAGRPPMGYICFADAGEIYTAQKNDKLSRLLNTSFLTLSENPTLSKVGKRKGFRHSDSIDTTVFMHSLFLSSAVHGHAHFFYGEDSRQLRLIKDYVKNSYMGIRVAGTQKTSKLPLEEEAAVLAITLNELRPAYFWCGLPSPKREQLLATLQPQLTHTTCIGVSDSFKILADAGLTLPDSGKESKSKASRFQALKKPSAQQSFSLPVAFWLLKHRVKAGFSSKSTGSKTKKSSSKSKSRRRSLS